MDKVINWLEQHSMPCMYKKILGVECPGCGMQRSFIELLKGNFIESFKIYPALIPTFVLVVFLILHLIFKFKKGAIILKILFIFVLLLMVFNYTIKNILFTN